MKKTGKILKKIASVFCWIIVIILVGMVVLSFIARITHSTPSVFGYSFYRVSSGSMEPELMVGDIILDKKVENPKELKVGDIITFDGGAETNNIPITHKIIKAPYEDIDGLWRLQTKGVANDQADAEITLEKVQSVMICTIPFLTQVYKVFLSPWGLIIFIVLILFIFFDEIINIIKIASGSYDSTEEKEDINDIISRLQKDSAVSDERSSSDNVDEQQ